MTETWVYYGSQGWLQTEKMATCQEQCAHIISYIIISNSLIYYLETQKGTK